MTEFCEFVASPVFACPEICAEHPQCVAAGMDPDFTCCSLSSGYRCCCDVPSPMPAGVEQTMAVLVYLGGVPCALLLLLPVVILGVGLSGDADLAQWNAGSWVFIWYARSLAVCLFLPYGVYVGITCTLFGLPGAVFLECIWLVCSWLVRWAFPDDEEKEEEEDTGRLRTRWYSRMYERAQRWLGMFMMVLLGSFGGFLKFLFDLVLLQHSLRLYVNVSYPEVTLPLALPDWPWIQRIGELLVALMYILKKLLGGVAASCDFTQPALSLSAICVAALLLIYLTRRDLLGMLAFGEECLRRRLHFLKAGVVRAAMNLVFGAMQLLIFLAAEAARRVVWESQGSFTMCVWEAEEYHAIILRLYYVWTARLMVALGFIIYIATMCGSMHHDGRIRTSSHSKLKGWATVACSTPRSGGGSSGPDLNVNLKFTRK